VTFQARLAAARGGDPDSLADLARAALEAGEEEQALPLLAAAAARTSDARLWQWTGLLQRAIEEHQAALRSFDEAARLAPSDQKIAHGRAHVALEAGLDAVDWFEQAMRLGPPNGDLVIGLAAARLAVGRGEQAAAELDAIVAQVPTWLEGHARLAQLRSLIGRPDLATASFRRALAVQPGEAALWRGLCDLHVRREEFAALDAEAERARAAGQSADLCDEFAAIAAAELGETERADRLFEALPASLASAHAVWRIRHLLRAGRTGEAIVTIDRELESDRAEAVWPYAATAWRIAGDPRHEWLSGDPRMVVVQDLRPQLPGPDRLAALLRTLHVASGEYLDQSVRGGTQTDGPLLSRIAPEFRSLRDAIVGAVQAYVAQLPPFDPGHPLLGRRRDRRIRFAGSWSVRLRAAGFHANHVHPQGWISSALYIALPERQDGEDEHSGWLALGEPPASLGLELAPTRLIEPREGQLVLFPSWMWHGTRPFADGERLTVAFDVAPPR
jgi:tetratricopeptide (TPR) repeat protein